MVDFNRNNWQSRYVKMLPAIEAQIKRALRGFVSEMLEPEKYDDISGELLAHTCVAYARLAERKQEWRAYPSALVNFAYRQYRTGRRVGNSQNVNDVFFPALFPMTGIKRINFGDDCADLDVSIKPTDAESEIIDALTCNRAPILEQVAFRIDCADWLRSLSPRKRDIARLMARGEGTADLAIMLGVSRARVSQYRRELETSWREFVGECE